MPARPSSAVARVRCGCAGWSISAADRAQVGQGASVLQRYATRVDAVEINSSFYRPHRASTCAHWADSVPEDVRFSVKLPHSISHDTRLHGTGPLLDAFLAQVGALGRGWAGCCCNCRPTLSSMQRWQPDSLRCCAGAGLAAWSARRATRAGLPHPHRPCWSAPHCSLRRRPGAVARGCHPEPGCRAVVLPLARRAAHLLPQLRRHRVAGVDRCGARRPTQQRAAAGRTLGDLRQQRGRLRDIQCAGIAALAGHRAQAPTRVGDGIPTRLYGAHLAAATARGHARFKLPGSAPIRLNRHAFRQHAGSAC